MSRRAGDRLRGLLARASLRVRVMATAAVLLTVSAAVMGTLGTILLRGDLLNRVGPDIAAEYEPPNGTRPSRHSAPPPGTPWPAPGSWAGSGSTIPTVS